MKKSGLKRATKPVVEGKKTEKICNCETCEDKATCAFLRFQTATNFRVVKPEFAQ